ncbi:MAG: tetratricopeptide repeat protein [Myxococcota bacterium]
MSDPSQTASPRLARRAARGRRLAGVALTFALGWLASGCGGDVEARMAEVRALQDVGQFSASIDELRQILAVSPDLPEATYRLGVALVQTGEPSRAVWALEKAAESSEYAIPAALLLASAHFGQHNFEAAIRASDRVLELDPERHAALRIRAQANLGAVRLDAALEDAKRLIEAYPDDYATMALYATVLADMEKMDEAREAHDKLKEIALAGGDPSVAHRGCLAPAFFARDNSKEPAVAEAAFDDCVERFPTNGFVLQEATAFYDDRGKRDKATSVLKQAVEQAPDNLSLHSQLSQRMASEGDLEGAEKVLRDAAQSFDSVGAWDLLAAFYRTNKQYEKALEALDEVIARSAGGSDQLNFAKADVLIDLGRFDDAEVVAASLQEKTYARLLRGRIELERGNPEQALRYFDEGIRAWPNNAGARYLAGAAARQVGDLDRAISELREAVRVDVNATPAAEMLARTYFERGQYTESLRIGKMAARRPGANRVDIYVVGARAFTELGKYADARVTLETLSQVPGGKVRAVVERITLERTAEGPAAAIAAVEASELDLTLPEHHEVLVGYVDALLADGRQDEALRQVDAAIAAHPEQAPAYALRGGALTRMNREDEARTAFEKSLALDPELAAGQAGLATLAARGNDLARGIALFDKAASLEPHTSAYPYSAAQLSLASGDLAGAEKRLRDVVRRFPTHAGARNDLAWILAEKGEELDWALELAEEAQRLDPSPEVLDTLGWVRFKRGEMSAAVAALEQASQSRRDSPSIRYRLGVALSKAGDSDRAREELQAAIAAGAFPEAADARRELSALDQ